MSELSLFAVTGNPIIHSKSPNMFNEAFRQIGISATYFRLASDSAKEAISVFRALDLKGMNVTAPFKEDVMPLLDKIDSSAEFIGGVNTIINNNGSVTGYNTDWVGVQMSLLEKLIPKTEWTTTRFFYNKKCIIIGASGAGKAAAFALKSLGAELTITNRTYDKAEKVAQKLGCRSAKFEELDSLVIESDIIIMALSQNINPIKQEWLRPEQIVFDANYIGSELIEIANLKGCKTIDASNWLIFQGAKAYGYFFDSEIPDYEIFQKGFDTYNIPKRANKIAMVGFMGSGKTSVGKKLAKKLNISFVDTDDMIVEREKMSIPEIFEKHGESYFRQCEREILESIIKSPERMIISCGGGMAINDQNREILKENCLVIWLYATAANTVSRINLETRPLLNVENPLEKATKLLEQRKRYYALAADLLINTEKFNTDNITIKVYDELKKIL